MKIKYNAHSCFTIQANDGTTVVTNPYEPGAFGGAIAYAPVADRPDIVPISHDHADHNYTKGFRKPFVEVRKTTEAKGIRFTAVPTFHDPEKGRLRGPNTVFVIEVDGVRVCHLGDLGHALEPTHVAAIGRVDVLLSPVGGTFTVDPDGAADAVGKLAPRVVIPMHYKTAKIGFDLAAVDAFLVGKKNVRRAGKSEAEFTPATLPAETTIVVLEHAN